MNSKSSQIHEIFSQVLKSRKKQRIQEQLKLVLSEDIGPSVPGQDMNTNINGAPSFGFAPAQLTMNSLSSYKLPLDLKDKLFKIIQTTPLQDTMAKINMVADYIQQMELMQQMQAEQEMLMQQQQQQEMDSGEMGMEQPQEEIPQEEMPQEEMPQENEEQPQEENIDSEEEKAPPLPKKKKKK